MQAILITPQTRSLEIIDISGHDDIVKQIGFDTITSDEIGSDGDRLFFDEECFLRGTEGRFQLDTLVPVSGKGVIAGCRDDGATLIDVTCDIDSLRARIKYL
jgi:hypothetical protein